MSLEQRIASDNSLLVSKIGKRQRPQEALHSATRTNGDLLPTQDLSTIVVAKSQTPQNQSTLCNTLQQTPTTQRSNRCEEYLATLRALAQRWWTSSRATSAPTSRMLNSDLLDAAWRATGKSAAMRSSQVLSNRKKLPKQHPAAASHDV